MSVIPQKSLLVPRPFHCILYGVKSAEPEDEKHQITSLLHLVSEGNEMAASKLMERVQSELHRIAASHFRRERHNHTLQPTALVNEAVIRLLDMDGVAWNNRLHFFAVASQAMHRILVDYARSRLALKRAATLISLQDIDAAIPPLQAEVLAVHTALEEFEQIFPRAARLVELRFFGGFTLRETAEIMNISERTADQDWAFARAWLKRKIGSERNTSGEVAGA